MRKNIPSKLHTATRQPDIDKDGNGYCWPVAALSKSVLPKFKTLAEVVPIKNDLSDDDSPPMRIVIHDAPQTIATASSRDLKHQTTHQQPNDIPTP